MILVRVFSSPQTFYLKWRILELQIHGTVKIGKEHQISTTIFTIKLCPQVPYPHVLNTSSVRVGFHHFPRQLVPMPHHTVSKEIFLNIQPKHPLAQPKAVPSHGLIPHILSPSKGKCQK